MQVIDKSSFDSNIEIADTTTISHDQRIVRCRKSQTTESAKSKRIDNSPVSNKLILNTKSKKSIPENVIIDTGFTSNSCMLDDVDDFVLRPKNINFYKKNYGPPPEYEISYQSKKCVEVEIKTGGVCVCEADKDIILTTSELADCIAIFLLGIDIKTGQDHVCFAHLPAREYSQTPEQRARNHSKMNGDAQRVFHDFVINHKIKNIQAVSNHEDPFTRPDTLSNLYHYLGLTPNLNSNHKIKLYLSPDMQGRKNGYTTVSGQFSKDKSENLVLELFTISGRKKLGQGDVPVKDGDLYETHYEHYKTQRAKTSRHWFNRFKFFRKSIG
ncbi:MAG: hypothetical protein GY874_21540 [Desulfobacteraceae bacterium]|nr:hypothetical protein [Desulfobacteraceae bacterium]